jgi:hypothetical protein
LSNDEESLSRYFSAYQLRRDFAEFSRRPEGVRFSWVSANGRTETASLLTPPSLEAVQRVDGSWYRVPRIDGRPIPYSQTWYEEYLRAHGLPSYFLRPRHLAMLFDDDESAHLQCPNAASAPLAAPLPRDHLESLYPAEPLWPEPGHLTYRLEGLSSERRANLVRHHPAVGIANFPYNVFVFPEGNIQLRSLDEVHDCPSISEAEVSWVPYDDGSVVPSSYHQDRTGPHPLSVANQSFERDALLQDAANSGSLAIINPREDIPGLGRLLFLSDEDRAEATRRGYATTRDVSMARRRGELANGTGPNAGPLVVFRPDPEFLNPVEEPQGPGAWRFLTSAVEGSDASLASINFGGTRGLPRYPSAAQIRRLGQVFLQEGRTNLTAEIDLVWVPGAEDEEEEVGIALDSEMDRQEDSEEEPETPSSDIRRSPRHNPDGLPVDPTNNHGVRGDDHDQTGDWAEYQTMRRLGGRIVTIDRSRTWFKHAEPHKLWCYSDKGWRKWLHADDMDWTDKQKVSNLNKHREQTHKRAKWPALREEKREDYKPAELEYVMEAVKATGGDRVKMDVKKLAAEFYRRFPLRTQSETGLQSLVDRLRTEYKLHGGLKHRNPRGWSRKLQSKATRGGNQGGQSKDRVQSEEEDDGEDGEDEGGEDGEDGEDGQEDGEEDGKEDEAGNNQHAE